MGDNKTISRRNVLKNTSALIGGTLAGIATSSQSAEAQGGGRGYQHILSHRDAPFTPDLFQTTNLAIRNCHHARERISGYDYRLDYEGIAFRGQLISYKPLDENQTYEFTSAQECRDPEWQNILFVTYRAVG